MSDPTDPSFWSQLGAGEVLAGLLSTFFIGLVTLVGMSEKSHRKEMKSYAVTHELIAKLRELPVTVDTLATDVGSVKEDIAAIKRDNHDFWDAVSEIREQQASMKTDISWLRTRRGDPGSTS